MNPNASTIQNLEKKHKYPILYTPKNVPPGNAWGLLHWAVRSPISTHPFSLFLFLPFFFFHFNISLTTRPPTDCQVDVGVPSNTLLSYGVKWAILFLQYNHEEGNSPEMSNFVSQLLGKVGHCPVSGWNISWKPCFEDWFGQLSLFHVLVEVIVLRL